MTASHATRRMLLIALVGAAVRAAFLLLPLEQLDALFIPDDTYYTLAIARSLAAGLGPSADGVTLTSGFQPLLAFLLVPVFWVTNTPDAPLYVSLGLGALADVFCVVGLCIIGRDRGRPELGEAVALVWAMCPLAVSNALGGLETALALALQVWLVEAWLARRSTVTVGVLCGLALLARIDSAFLVALLGLMSWRREGLLSTLPRAAVAAVTVVPWWGYCLLRFGSVVPESGAAVRDIVSTHQQLYLTVPVQLAWSAGSVLSAPFSEGTGLREWLAANPALATTAAMLAAVALLGATVRLARAREEELAAFFAHALVLFGFYTLYLPALWFLRRYLVAAELGFIAALVLALDQWLPTRRNVLTVTCAAMSVVTLAAWASSGATTSLDAGLHGAKGYRRAAREVFELTPPDAVVGALQSGALSYYAPAGTRVVNLDGVVDRGARDAARRRDLLGWARSRGVTHVADWPFNLKQLQAHSAQTLTGRLLGTTTPQGSDAFLVYALQP